MDSGTLIPGVEYVYDDYRFSLTVDDSSSEHKAIIASCRNVKSGENGSKNRLVGKSSVVEGWHVYIDENNENNDLIAEIYAIGTFTDTRTPTVLHVDSRQTKTFYEADEIGNPIDFSGLVVGAYYGSVYSSNLFGTIPLDELLFSSSIKQARQLTPSDYYPADECFVEYSHCSFVDGVYVIPDGAKFGGIVEDSTTRPETSSIIWNNSITFTYSIPNTIYSFTYSYSALDTGEGLPAARFFFAEDSQGVVRAYVTYLVINGTENKNIVSYDYYYNGVYQGAYSFKGNVGDFGQTRFVCDDADEGQFDDFVGSLTKLEGAGNNLYKDSNNVVYSVSFVNNKPSTVSLTAKTDELSKVDRDSIDSSLINTIPYNISTASYSYRIDFLTIQIWTGRVRKNILTVPIRITWNNMNISNPEYIYIKVVQP